MLNRFSILCLSLACAVALTTSAAPASERHSPNYRLDQWTTADGLPSWQIRDLMQGADGYLWIATPVGLVRFDGQQFHRFDQSSITGLPTNRIQSVHSSRGGDVLFGGNDFLLRIVGDGVAEPVASVTGMVHAVAEDSTGRMWLYKDDGRLAFLDNDGRVISAPENRAEGFVVDHDAELWVREVDGAIVRVAGDHREETQIQQLVPDSPLWVLHRQLLTSPKDGRPLDVRQSGDRIEVRDPSRGLIATYPISDDTIAWLVDRHDNLWVARRGEIAAYRGTATEPVFRQSLGQETLVSEILEDFEGNLWIATRARGIFRLRPDVFEFYAKPPGQLFRSFMRTSDGRVVVDAEPGAYEVGEGGLRPFRLADGTHAKSVHIDPRGETWIGDGQRLYGRVGGQSVTIEGVAGRRFANTADPGGFWVGDAAGLHRVHTAGPNAAQIERRFADRINGLPLLHVDRHGALWVAATGALYRVVSDDLERVDLGDSFDRIDIRAFLEDLDGTLWLGTVDRGLIRWRDGRASSVGSAEGLSEDGVFSILEDAAGRFWMSGNRGIFRAARRELEAFFDGTTDHVESAHFGNEPGLINPEEGGNLGIAVGDRLLFSTHFGVMRIDPSMADEFTTAAPLVRVHRATVEGTAVPIAESTIVLEPDQRSVDVGYTAISMRDPDAVQFQIRLDPYDSDWIRVGADRHARYGKLQPDRYTFRVRATSGAGIDSAEEAQLTIVVRPHFWETTLFRFGVVLFALATLYGLYAFRLRGLRQRELWLDEQVRTRTEELARERDRAAETSRVIEAQARRLEELDETKSKFFANVSHEFRTPLTLILGPLEDVLAGRHGDVPDDAAKQVRLANENGARLLRLVNQLLDTARLEAGRLKLKYEQTNLSAFLRRMIDIFEPLAERAKIELTTDIAKELPAVWIDPEQFEKVIVNLLSNAFKFTAGEGRVDLICSRDGDEIRIQIRDNGAGIPEEALERVFDRFYQTDPRHGISQAGTGIGLALSRDLVELHYGSITATSRAGEGATFEVRLLTGNAHLPAEQLVDPTVDELEQRLRSARRDEEASRIVLDAAAPPTAGEEQPSQETEADASEDRTTVLVVEDNDEMRSYIRARLASRFRVREAVNGIEALESVAERLPDLIVSDLMMPKMDGLELCRRIKATRELDFVPFVLLTAKASIDSRVEGLESGADDYLPKPFDGRELIARISNLLESRRRLKQRLMNRDEQLPELTTDSNADELVQRIHSVIDENIGDETFGVDELATALAQSRRTLYRRTDELGLKPADLIQQRRLEQAAKLLANGRGNVTDVAYAVGFRSVSHFSRRFRAHHGVSPSAMRPD